MGIFDFFRKKAPAAPGPESKVILVMPLFCHGDRYELSRVTDHLRSYWKLPVTDITGDDDNAIFRIDGEKVLLSFMSFQIPMDEIAHAAQYAYYWDTAMETVGEHTGHAIVSLMPGGKSAFERTRIMSKIICSLLSTSNAVAVYKGTQSLLIPSDLYLEHVEEIRSGGPSTPLWVYMGTHRSENGNSAFTYGLSAFDKKELEIVNSALSTEELYNMMFNICSYVISRNVTFKSGQTLGFSAKQKIRITDSDGQFFKGETLRLEM